MAEENAQPEEEKEVVEAPKADASKVEAPKAEAAKKVAAKKEAPKAEAAKKVAAKKDAPKAEAVKVDAPKKDAAKKDGPKAEAAKVDAPKKVAAKKDAPKTDAPKAEAEGEESPEKEVEEELAPGGVKKQPTAQELLKEEIGDLKIRKAKGSKNVTTGIAKVSATFNNTIVTITDTKGNTISWASAGKMNFRGSRKSTAYAAQIVTQNAAKAAMSHGLKEVSIHVKGPGMGRDSAIRAFQSLGLEITSIVDTTPIPHNGCRPPKRRRV
jgi:small subunit ribosomal protein S11